MDLMTQYSEVVMDAMRAIVKDERANILKAADLLSDETRGISLRAIIRLRDIVRLFIAV